MTLGPRLASTNLFPKVILEEVANDGSDTPTPEAGHRAVFLGVDGGLRLKDDADAVTTVGGGAVAAEDVSLADVGGLIAATDVEGAIAELAGDDATIAGAVSAHIADTTDAHDASAISVADAGGLLTATEVEAALAELATAIAGLGGGGGIALPTVVQVVQNAHGAGGLAMTIAQPATTSLLVWIAAQNGGAAVPTLTNWTWTQRRTDNVGGVGNLTIYTGEYDGSGTPGTSISTSGGGGLSSAMLIELADTTYVGMGSGSIYAGQTQSNHKNTLPIFPQDVGSVICFIAHTAGSAGTAPAELTTPYIQCPGNAAQPLAMGFSLGIPVVGSYSPGQVYYTLAEVRISF